MTPFAAVLLAGGQSRRMGRDKALLPLADGRVLWQRQLAVLQKLGPAELFISGPAREGFPPGVTLLADETPGLGPLAGITAALGAMGSPRLVVLAVDLAGMTADYLGGLLASHSTIAPDHGTIPQAGNGFFEPLAAVYPKSSLLLAREQLRAEDRSLQTFVRRLIECGQAATCRISPEESGLFVNWNQLEDYASS